MAQREKIVYIKAERSSQVNKEDVFLKDIATIVCQDSVLEAKVKAMKLHHFKENEETRFVISIMEIIWQIQKMQPDAEIVNLGEADMMVRYIQVEHGKRWWLYLKIAFVSLICFFGSAFSIMAFHNDVGIVNVFGRIYEMVMGKASGGFTTLEVSYSIGLTFGIILFFNHIGKRKLSKDPTPVAVEMRIYEEDVEKTLIVTAAREQKEKDADN